MKITFTPKKSWLQFSKAFMVSGLVSATLLVNGQQYTESFSSAPTLTPDPITPTWMEKATVALGRTTYDFVSGGNGGWEYKTSGGAGNTPNLLYSSAATTTVTIKRRDGKRFQFYGAWLKYTNLVDAYTPPWLRVTYEGSTLPFAVYNNNTTVILSQNVNVTSVSLYFSGLHTLNFDNIIVGPAIPIAAISMTDDVINYTENTATVGGRVTDDGGSAVTESGLVYGTNAAPTIANTKLALSNGVSAFSQLITGLQSNTTYFVRSYAINSTGIAYGNEQSFTTFGAFATDGSHNFNTSWASSVNQPSPFTKYIEGWDVSGRSTGAGLVSIYRLTDADAAEGMASLRVADDEYTESLMYLAIKTHNQSSFNLKQFVFRYDAQQIGEGASYGTITITGFKNGAAVPGASQTITNIAPSANDPSYHQFTANNNSFDGIDEFRLTASDPVNNARLYSFDLDEIVTATNTTLPVTFTSVKAYQKNMGVQVEWKVASESIVDHYEIEKSQNGKQFTKLAERLPQNNNNSFANYEWFDDDMNTGNSYYRIKPVFKTGTFTYSQVMIIIISDALKKGISVYPNPTVGQSINLRLNNQPKGEYTIRVYDAGGVTLLRTTVNHGGGSLTQSIPLDSRFSKGIYQLKVESKSGSYSHKIIKN